MLAGLGIPPAFAFVVGIIFLVVGVFVLDLKDIINVKNVY
jgi:hypothetical protein